MKKKLYKSNLSLYLACSVFIGIGIICFVMTIIMFATSLMNKVRFDEVTAEIVEINVERNSLSETQRGGELYYEVYIDYIYDAEIYEYVNLGTYIAGMYEGEEVDILVNPEDPTEIKMVGQDAINIAGGLFGGILSLGLGIFLFYPEYKKWKKKKDLLEFGNYIYAVVDSVEKELKISVGKNKEHPYIVYCTYTDEVTGMKYKFKSDTFWLDPYPKIKVGTKIKVYVDDAEFINHYVSIEEAFEA